MLEEFIISRIRAELPFEPNEEKEQLFQMLGRYLVSNDPLRAFILSGYAGTGKTSVVSALVRAMEKLNQPCMLLAPTGRAAKVIARYSERPAYTIHKFIYRQDQLGVESFSLADNKHVNTLFIVDESSMISAQRDNASFGSGNLLDDLVQYVYQGQGCHLMLLGDSAQLPPVGSLQSPALSSDRMAGYGLHVSRFELTQVARQALDSGILAEATRIREIIQNNPSIQSIPNIPNNQNSPIILQADGRDIIRLQGADVVEQLEQSYREAGEEETLIITRSNKATNLYNQGVRARILWKEDEFSTGDRLMVSKNNYFWTQEYEGIDFLANGDSLEVVRTRNQHEMYGFRFVEASLRATDYNWEIDAMVWLDTLFTDTPEQNYRLQQQLFQAIAEDFPEVKNRKERTKLIYQSPYYNALQVRFAYAVTCHKAQGGQWRHVYIDSGLTNERVNELTQSEREGYLRWLYTALTRSTERIFLLR